eukprot:6982707-Karenia_brevis.AAC.1
MQLAYAEVSFSAASVAFELAQKWQQYMPMLEHVRLTTLLFPHLSQCSHQFPGAKGGQWQIALLALKA